jgi:hypothetical protein
MAAIEPWKIKGELILSCSCHVFCPCVISLGEHPPTEGHCQTWGGIKIDSGNYGEIDLSGIDIALMIEIPGLMSRGNWTVGAYIDEKADAYQLRALTKILSGRAKGTTFLFSILVGKFVGVYQEKVTYEIDGDIRRVKVPKMIDGEIQPIAGKRKGEPVVIQNSQYWIAPEIMVARANKSKFRAFGRNWDFKGRSAEICELDWSGP